MSTEEAREGATTDPSSGATVRTLTGRTIAGVTAPTSMPKVAASATVDLRKRKNEQRRRVMDR